MKMGIDGKISKYLTDRHFSRLLRRMKSVGVKFVEANTVEGIIFFVSDTEQLKHRSLEGTLHAKLLDPRRGFMWWNKSLSGMVLYNL